MNASTNAIQLAAQRLSGLIALARSRPAALGAWLGQVGLPFVLIVYLGLRGGGHDLVVRSEIGIAAWWIVLLLSAVGTLPLVRLNRAAWIGLGLFAAFAAWTALGIGWSESAERSAAELGRVATLIGVFALALAVQGEHGLRRAVGGVAAAIVLVCGIALLSRLHPGWFPEPETPRFLPESQARLHYPLGYWNGLAAFAALGVPLLLALATTARQTFARALAVAGLPALALTIFFTLSRGGALETAVALTVLFALHPRRLALLAPAALAAAAAAILVIAADQRDALTDGLTSAGAQSQGDAMLALTLVVCAGAGVGGALIAIADRRGWGPHIQVPRRLAGGLAGGAGVVVLVVALAAGVSSEISESWNEFKEPAVPEAQSDRFTSVSSC